MICFSSWIWIHLIEIIHSSSEFSQRVVHPSLTFITFPEILVFVISFIEQYFYVVSTHTVTGFLIQDFDYSPSYYQHQCFSVQCNTLCIDFLFTSYTRNFIMIITELRARKQTSMRTDVLFPPPPPPLLIFILYSTILKCCILYYNLSMSYNH